MPSLLRHPVLLLFMLALVVRLAAAGVLGIDGPLTEDEVGYHRIAVSLTEGRGFELPIADRVGLTADQAPPRTSFRAPVMPLVLAPLVAGGAGPTALRLLSLLFGALAPPLLWLALRRGPLPERGALVVAAAYALWPPAVYLSLRVLSEPLSMALLLGGLALWAPLRPLTGASADSPPPGPLVGSGRCAVAFGALAALAVLAKPALVFAAGLALLTRGRRALVTAVVLFAAVLAPWIVRNTLLHGRPLVTSNSGVTLVGANSVAAARADVPGKWLAPERVYAAEDAPRLGMWGWASLTEGQSDARFARDAVEWARAHPGDAATLTFWKIVRLFDPDPRSSKGDAGSKRLVGWLSLTPVLLLALVGIARVARAPPPGSTLLPWAALLVGTVAIAAVFYGDARMRTGADPALLVLAAIGVFGCASRGAAGNPSGEGASHG